jgi:integrase/recombinase XerD
LEYLQTSKNQENITRRNSLIALNHYFTYLAINKQVAQNPTSLIKIRGTHKRHLYSIYTAEELQALLDNYYHVYIKTFDDSHIPKNQRQQSFLSRHRNHTMLGLLVNQGLSTSELQKINLHDLDLQKATIRVAGGKKSNPRTLPLAASQIGSLIQYINTIRPQFTQFCTESERLFFALPESSKQKTSTTNLMHTFKPLTKQVKEIDNNLVNFKQVRASVITHWLKTEGLRKTQYLAGHRHISSTENYQPNNLDGLIDDITKFNPF